MNVVLRNRSGFANPFSFRHNAFDHRLERLMSDVLEDFVSGAATSDLSVVAPRINLVETAKGFDLQAEIPGVKKEDIRISIDGNRVSFEAEVRESQENKEGESILHAERIAKKFTRVFTLPAEVDEDSAIARLEDGILRLELPKKQAAQPKQITVQ